MEKTEKELENGKCLIHPHLEIEELEEENYFFRFSRYQEKLLEFYQKYPDFVVPDFRFNEIKKFVEAGLNDFSISRLKEKMPWGVPVPGDENQVMYVWFDALINYISTLGWPFSAKASKGKTSDFDQFWGTIDNPKAIQIAGKDNLRQQTAMWQAMLMSAGLPTSRQVIIHGFVTSGGQKMSKSLGNVADPYQIMDKLQTLGLTKEQATDALRYYLAREIPTFEDGDYTWEHFKEAYNANLANGLGNLVSRVMKMAIANSIFLPPGLERVAEGRERSNQYLDKYELQKAMDEIWQQVDYTSKDDISSLEGKSLHGIRSIVVSGVQPSVAAMDEYIQKTEPFKTIKTDFEKAKKDIEYLLFQLHQIAYSLQPFLPQTSEKILKVLKKPTSEEIPKLFPRIE